MWNNDYTIYFKYGGHTVRGVFTNDSIFLSHRPNLSPPVAIFVFPFPQIRPQPVLNYHKDSAV